MSSLILWFCSSMRELFSKTSFFKHSFSYQRESSGQSPCRHGDAAAAPGGLTWTILWMLCRMMEVSMGILDTPADRPACFWRSSTCHKRGRRHQRAAPNNSLLNRKGSTFELSRSTLSTTFPMDKRISVFCCLASVIKKVVTSVEPGPPPTRTMTGIKLCPTGARPSGNLPVFGGLTYVRGRLCGTHGSGRLQRCVSH